METLGKVRPEHVKKIARELMGFYPNRFSKDFQANKEAVGSVAQIPSVKLRNRIAGYITSLVSTALSETEENEAFENVEKEEEVETENE